MPEQFIVPQFLDVETKIIGPITGRQFLILLATLLVEFVIYRVFLNVIAVIAIGVPVLGIGITFAFAKVNGQPFHYIMLSMIQTLRRPMVRVWDKTISDAQLKAMMKNVEPEKRKVVVPKKQPLEQSRLSEISLVVNTGGSYNPEASDHS